MFLCFRSFDSAVSIDVLYEWLLSFVPYICTSESHSKLYLISNMNVPFHQRVLNPLNFECQQAVFLFHSYTTILRTFSFPWQCVHVFFSSVSNCYVCISCIFFPCCPSVMLASVAILAFLVWLSSSSFIMICLINDTQFQ